MDVTCRSFNPFSALDNFNLLPLGSHGSRGYAAKEMPALPRNLASVLASLAFDDYFPCTPDGIETVFMHPQMTNILLMFQNEAEYYSALCISQRLGGLCLVP